MNVRRRAANRPRPETKLAKKDDRFRVLIAVHRPRYRSRAERAVDLPGWEVLSLTNKQDPIGLITQQRPDILIISDDFGRNKTLGYIRAAQRWRPEGMKVIAVFEDEEVAEGATELYDAAFLPPWKSLEMRATAAAIFEDLRGEPAHLPQLHAEDTEE